MTVYEKTCEILAADPKVWLVTGGAGFIGSNLVEALLKLGQNVVVLDNFSTGHKENVAAVQSSVSSSQWMRFRLKQGDIRNVDDCRDACVGVDYVLHQAALGSVPRSIDNPILTNENNVSGFLNMLVAAKDAGVRNFVFAASSSTYGDHPALPKVENVIGRPLSPYAVTKYVNELYAEVFFKTYGLNTVGLRYFNVFGRRQDPNGAYAAVVPKWAASMIKGDPVYINGDGLTSRDFCYIDNVVQANILAATTANVGALNQIYNVAVGDQTSLMDLFSFIKGAVVAHVPSADRSKPILREFRTGDVRHSLADISKARRLLGYVPSHNVQSGLLEAMGWYVSNLDA